MIEEIRRLIVKHCNIPGDVAAIAVDADLYGAGLTSFASVQLMLALEDRYDVEFPERMLNRKTFSSIQAIADALTQIVPEGMAA